MLEPMVWYPIQQLPKDEYLRVLVYDPREIKRPILEARASSDGEYCDPTYYEWFASGATHFMLLPPPPTN